MSEHPIEGLMKTAMNSIESLVDVNTIVGESIVVAENIIIIPISKVCFGFASGGSEFRAESMTGYKRYEKEETAEYKLPFGGGSGAAVNIKPVAFVIISGDTVKVTPIEHVSVLDKLIDYVPDFMQKLKVSTDKAMEKCNLKEKMKKDFDYELSKKNMCNCKNKKQNNENKENDDNKENMESKEDDNFEAEKSKVKSVSSIVSNKGPITKKKVKIEYEDDLKDFGLENNNQDENEQDNSNNENDDNMEDD